MPADREPLRATGTLIAVDEQHDINPVELPCPSGHNERWNPRLGSKHETIGDQREPTH
jgi:hypothetical protein